VFALISRISSRNAVIAFVLVMSVLTVEAGLTQAVPSSNLLSVPYRAQEKNYYCGPASVQMVMVYLTGSLISQDQLAAELDTDHVKKTTYTSTMRNPFDLRGFTQTFERKPMSLSELKSENARGYPVILLIWFQMPHTESQHYVVVVGYDETGVFINDPWPTQWGRPGRNTGAQVYVSDTDLEYLWSCSYPHWGLVVPYTQTVTAYAAYISIRGIPSSLRTTVAVDGTTKEIVDAKESLKFNFDRGTTHIISVEKYVSGSKGVRYKCESDTWRVSSEGSHTFEYVTQYYLSVSSRYGTTVGEGWYDSGSTATFSVESATAQLEGTPRVRYIFKRWSGDSSSTSATATILMDGPKAVEAMWEANYGIIIVLFCLLIGAPMVIL